MGRLVPFTFTHKKWWHIYNFCRCPWCNYLLRNDLDMVNVHLFCVVKALIAAFLYP